MRTARQSGDSDGLATLDGDDTRVLEPREERALLARLAACKGRLSEALRAIPGFEPPEASDDPQAVSQQIAAFYAGDPRAEAKLGALYREYNDLRGRLALANLRLVAHVAKRFRDRGVAYSDLMQEGFCGLLEAIDRFDLAHGTKLATYATWWIRQAVQRAVAGGAYPVRLSPRHLRQLARDQEELDRPGGPARGQDGAAGSHASTEMIRRIHAATRPPVSLDATLGAESDFSLLQTMSDPEGDRTGVVDMGEAVGRLMEGLRPREQEVLALRFGLGGKPRLSLSQVGKVLEVSKERVRQIQDRAIEKLRDLAAESGLLEALPLGA
jgi:RNA polymerase primary sigma factor